MEYKKLRKSIGLYVWGLYLGLIGMIILFYILTR